MVSKELLTVDERIGSRDAQLDAFVATLCGNRVREMYPSHIYWPTVAQCRRTFELVEDGGLKRSETGFNAFQNSVQDFTPGRCLFKSRDYIGFGPQSAAKGKVN